MMDEFSEKAAHRGAQARSNLVAALREFSRYPASGLAPLDVAARSLQPPQTSVIRA
jgi:hypothetical protein